MGILKCPLIMIRLFKQNADCMKEECAWWVPANAYPWPAEGECSVQTIAKGVKQMGDESLLRSTPISYKETTADPPDDPTWAPSTGGGPAPGDWVPRHGSDKLDARPVDGDKI